MDGCGDCGCVTRGKQINLFFVTRKTKRVQKSELREMQDNELSIEILFPPETCLSFFINFLCGEFQSFYELNTSVDKA